MLKVFSRALEARSSCQCAFCAPVRPAIKRKISSLPIRQLKFGDVVTVVYGTVLGTAAFYDGGSKDRKREALNNAIKDVLAENEAIKYNQEARLKALGYDGSEDFARTSRSSSISETTKRPNISRRSSRSRRYYSQDAAAEGFESAFADLMAVQERMQKKTELRHLTRLRPSEFNDAVAYEAMRRRKAKLVSPLWPEVRRTGDTIQEAWEQTTVVPSELHARVREITIAMLVMNLIQVYFQTFITAKDKHFQINLNVDDGDNLGFGVESLAELKKNVANLSNYIEVIKEQFSKDSSDLLPRPVSSPRFPVYNRSHGDKSRYHQEIARENARLISICQHANGPAQLVTDACSFLLNLGACPNIHTLNILLVHFLDIQWFKAAKAVNGAMATFMSSHNEVSDLARLRLFNATNESLNFDSCRALMMGIDGRSSRSAHEHSKIVSHGYYEDEIIQQGSMKAGIFSVTYGLKARWTEDAFSTVILDLLERENLAEAYTEMANMRLSGYRETPEILQALLEYACHKKDWALAVKTWSTFGELGIERSVLHYYWMMQICASCRKPESFRLTMCSGKEAGILNRDIQFIFEDFRMAEDGHDALKSRSQALRRLQYRIHVPQTPQRELQMQDQDIIQMATLQQTLLVLYLQYAKLRTGISGWFHDHMEQLASAESQFLALASDNLEAGVEIWTNTAGRQWRGYDVKLQAIAAICNEFVYQDSKVTTAVLRIAQAPASEISSDAQLPLVIEAFERKTPVPSAFLALKQRQDVILQHIEARQAMNPAGSLETTDIEAVPDLVEVSRLANAMETSLLEDNKENDLSDTDSEPQTPTDNYNRYGYYLSKLPDGAANDAYEWWLGKDKKNEIVKMSHKEALDYHLKGTLHANSPMHIKAVLIRRDEQGELHLVAPEEQLTGDDEFEEGLQEEPKQRDVADQEEEEHPEKYTSVFEIPKIKFAIRRIREKRYRGPHFGNCRPRSILSSIPAPEVDASSEADIRPEPEQETQAYAAMA